MSAFTMFKPRNSCRRVELHGQRPSPLLLQKTSHAIKKSTPRKPVVIHMVSPKVIHVRPSEFMSLVQQLTGAGPSSSPPPPATTTTEDKTAGKGELPGRGSPVRVEAVRAPSQHVPTTETPAALAPRDPPHASDQPSSWYEFFKGQSSSAPVSSSGHVLSSPGSCVDVSCRVVIKET